MITLQEAERLLDAHIADRPQEPAGSVSEFLTTLVSAGAFRQLDANDVLRELVQEGVTHTAAAYTVRVLRKLGVVA